MTAPIESITIVGGGTAGWMAAAMLDTFLNRRAGGQKVTITLIESPDAPTIGVGEATVPAMPRALAQMEISEQEFYRRCNASYKLGVLFGAWDVDRNGEPRSYINPFNAEHGLGRLPVSRYFRCFAEAGARYDSGVDLARALVGANKGPMRINAPGEPALINFAYHFDAGAFAQLLRDTAIARGVNHVLDHVDDVELDARGFVAALQLRAAGRTPVELVIDCTGFQGLIINKALGEPFESYGDRMLNDKALALQVPYTPGAKLEPATRSTALGAGWSWRVPLYHRVGTGYVFSSAHRTDEAAIAEFLDHLGLSRDDVEPRVIPMRIGRTRRGWVKNCVAIGLSSGFVEPLESTAIFIIDTSIRWLSEYFPDKDFSPVVAERFNRNARILYEEISDFIGLHYVLSNRRDTDYWRAANDANRISDRLRENLALWKHVLPSSRDLASEYIFPQDTYKVVLFGKGFYDDKRIEDDPALNPAHWREFQKQFAARKAELLRALPDHRELLACKRGEAPKAPHALLAAGAAPRASTVPAPTGALSGDGSLL